MSQLGVESMQTETRISVPDSFYLRAYSKPERLNPPCLVRVASEFGPRWKHDGKSLALLAGLGFCILVGLTLGQNPSAVSTLPGDQHVVSSDRAPQPFVAPSLPSHESDPLTSQAGPPAGSPALSKNAPSENSSTTEAERLRARNRRLEALIRVLKKRPQPGVAKVESTSLYLSQ